MTTTAHPSATQERELFVRGSSGLVRDLRFRDTFIMNFGYAGASFSLSLAFVISQALWAYPTGHFILAFVIGVALCAPGVILAYALMSAAMPRAGGDYVYISRMIHPFLGFMTSFTLMIMLFFFVAWGAYWGGVQSLSTVFATVGHTTNAGWLIDAGTWVASQTGAFIVGVLVILFFTAIAAAGIRVFARLLVVMFALGLVGTLVGLSIFAFVSPDTFVANFNQFMTRFTDDQSYYQTVIDRATAGGTPLSGFSFGSTLALLPILAFSTIFTLSSTYVGSEVRNPTKVQLWSMPLSLLALGCMNIVVFVLLARFVGGDFLTSVNTLWFNGELAELPLFPFFNLFATVGSNSAILAVLIGIGYLAMSMLFIPVQIAASTRLLFAYSFDRILPAKLSDLHWRTRVPVYALVPMAVISIGFLAILVYTTWFATLSGTAGLFPAMILACLAAVIFPWRSEGFRESPIGKLRIGRVPLIIPAGILGAGFLIGVFVAYLRNDVYLVNTRTSLTLIVATLAAGALIFAISWFIRRAQGINLLQIYRSIPPA